MVLAADKCYLSSFNLLLSIPSSVLSYLLLPCSLSLLFHLRMPQVGSRRQAQAPCMGGRPLCLGLCWVPKAASPEAGPGSPVPRPARPTAPTYHPLDPGMLGVFVGMPVGAVGGDRAGRALAGPEGKEVWRWRDTL